MAALHCPEWYFIPFLERKAELQGVFRGWDQGPFVKD